MAAQNAAYRREYMSMVKRHLQSPLHQRAGFWLALAVMPLCALSSAPAPGVETLLKAKASKSKAHPLAERLPDKPSQPPAFTIPVESLGFTSPGALYLGKRNSFASLDFLDENRLLFTFRVPGLIRRETADSDQGDTRQIRALVLTLPAGVVEAEALWSVHDRARYLWMLKDGHFLLRDREVIEQGDEALKLKPFLHFPGPVLWLQMDPAQQFLVTDSREPAAAAQKPQDTPAPTPQPGDLGVRLHSSDQGLSLGTTASAAASLVVEGQNPDAKMETVVRILRRDSGQVMLVSRVHSVIHLPINSDGYLESLRAGGVHWVLNLNYFTGGSKIVGRLDSTCPPTFSFVSEQQVLAATCSTSGGRSLVAMDTSGQLLWEDSTSGELIWPLIVMSPDGSRLARETLAVSHAISASDPLENEDIKGQLIEVFDTHDGNVALRATASPVLDAGGNVAISPSGRRVAVLSGGSIQVFELPAPPPIKGPPGSQPPH